ncbi:MAG: hypothetical protein AUI11_04185 [Acidobacteria bacterium 13_2_20CM_2_66_4]|nr:MAG: hypothetical protein AUI11_04185 [Acidobacteria bacterium 13_2_20CM_2_66_4]
MDPLSYLFSLEHFGIKFGLENITAIVERLGRPDRTFKSVHVAGTNGKGSVTAMVDAALRAAGHRTARYTSPHLTDLSERFVIGGRPVAHDTLVCAAATVRDVVESLRFDGTLGVQPTFFEVTTAVAFELFRRAEGIIKAGVPIVVGPVDPESLSVIARVANERGATLIRATPADAAPFTLGLHGDHQRANAGVAVRLLEQLTARGVGVPSDAVARGLANPEWPGRLDQRRLPDGRELLLDAAHNPAGAAALASYLTAESQRRPLVFAAMRDKDIDGMFRILLPAIGAAVMTRASNPRSADPGMLADSARTIAPALPIAIEPSSTDALAAAWRMSPRIVVAGSIFLLGDVMQQLGLHSY